MTQHRKHRNESFDNKLFNLMHKFIALLLPIVVVVHYVVEDRGEGALVPLIGVVHALVELELAFVLAVYRVVSQVHEHVAQVFLGWLLVGFGRETGHALTEEVDLQGLDGY